MWSGCRRQGGDLKEARDQAFATRRVARAGGDPLAEKRRARGTPTFADAAARVRDHKRAGWRNPKHAHDWPASLERFVFPRFGERPVSEISSADVLGVLAPIWHEKPETARRVRQRIGAVMQWAVAMEYRADDPCDRVAATLGRRRDVLRYMRALPHSEVASAVATVRASRATMAAELAFEFLVLTAARSGEVRLARWEEIDLEADVWTVPAERMKANREHRVPLSFAGREDARGGAEVVQRERPRVPEPARQTPFRHDSVQAAQGAGHPGRAARLPIERVPPTPDGRLGGVS